MTEQGGLTPPGNAGYRAEAEEARAESAVVRAGRYAWAVVGLVAIVVLLGFLAGRLRRPRVRTAKELRPNDSIDCCLCDHCNQR